MTVKAPKTRGGYRNRDDAADDGMRRRIFPLSLSPGERDALEAAADEAGESMAEYARTAVAERIARDAVHTSVQSGHRDAKPAKSAKPARSR